MTLQKHFIGNDVFVNKYLYITGDSVLWFLNLKTVLVFIAKSKRFVLSHIDVLTHIRTLVITQQPQQPKVLKYRVEYL